MMNMTGDQKIYMGIDLLIHQLIVASVHLMVIPIVILLVIPLIISMVVDSLIVLTYNLHEHSGFQLFHGSQYFQSQYGRLGTTYQPNLIPLHPDVVVRKYQQLKMPSGMSQLAVKLVRKCLFGKLSWKRFSTRKK